MSCESKAEVDGKDGGKKLSIKVRCKWPRPRPKPISIR